MWWRRLVVCLALAGCTKSNPAKDCTDGSCSDPAFPFCDVSGAISGEVGVCIASSCSADQFVECRGDVEVRCNPDGSNYNLVTCDRGCEPGDGCRLCDPGETACTNGYLATCDAAGAVVSKSQCALGCDGDEPRCRDIDPSNGLAAYVDAVSAPPDLDLSSGRWFIDTTNGSITNPDTSQQVILPSFSVAAPTGGAAIRVFVVAGARLGNVQIGNSESPAIAIVARGDIEVVGPVTVSAGVGSVRVSGCNGGPADVFIDNGTQCINAASGGGGHATSGAPGGGIASKASGGTSGTASGTETLVPLRGGCAAGGIEPENAQTQLGLAGGGAMQLSSATRITVTGSIAAVGGEPREPGDYGPAGCGYTMFGGGGGGALLLEAPLVTLESAANISVRGGNGTQEGQAGTYVGTGGAGATATSAAQMGGDSAYVATGQNLFIGGGGGGGLGRIRINTVDGAYTKSSSAVEDGAVSTGVLSTR